MKVVVRFRHALAGFLLFSLFLLVISPILLLIISPVFVVRLVVRPVVRPAIRPAIRPVVRASFVLWFIVLAICSLPYPSSKGRAGAGISVGQEL